VHARKSTRERQLTLRFAFFAWFAWAVLLAEIATTATGKACNERKTLGQLGLVCVLNNTNVVFQIAIFLILVIRNKRSSGFEGTTSDCLSRNCLF